MLRLLSWFKLAGTISVHAVRISTWAASAVRGLCYRKRGCMIFIGLFPCHESAS